jgi:photosystem II stability/assembly factor-like uncharacterized protein
MGFKTQWEVLAILVTALSTLQSVTTIQAQQWEQLPIVHKATLAAGFKGGEGGQVIRSIAISASDPDFLMMGTDVGGLYRSLNGGQQWEPCNVGWSTRGANAFAIDPRNANRVLGAGGNSIDWKVGDVGVNGLYLSTDKASSWRHVLPMPEAHGGSIAFDAAFYNAARGFCTVAYFSSPKSGIWKTLDGGATWQQVNAHLSKTLIRVHPTKGVVYAASSNESDAGLWRSTDGGTNFSRVSDVTTWGIDVIESAPDTVYISRLGGVFVSTDAGVSFTHAGNNSGLPEGKPARNVQVSPVKPRNMVCYTDMWHMTTRHYSNDGGNSWAEVKFDNTLATLPYNRRDGVWVWHPLQGNTIYGNGGDWITRSTDAGKTFSWYASGYNGIMLGGMFNFSPTSPDTVALFFQDYNGAFTLDRGKSWNYRDVSGKGWGGYCYGGYAVDAQVMWGGDAESWGGKRQLRVSRDGGATWPLAKDAGGEVITFFGPDVSYSDPTDPNIGFASNWRTTDKGATWTAMTGCDAVYAFNLKGSPILFGKKGEDIVRSADKGATWTKVVTVPGRFFDLAYDFARNRFYVAAEDKLLQFENDSWTTLRAPSNQFGSVRVTTVAVDPVNTAVVYTGGPSNVYANHATVSRSTDAGKTWLNLTTRAPRSNTQRDSPHEVQAIRVHPRTREVWVSGQCYGMWKIAPPR